MRTLLLAVAAVLFATCAYAQAPNEETVTIRADGTPIGTLLAALAQRHRLEKVTIQAEVRQHPVWIALDEVPLPLALRRILEASGLDFAISGRRVIVGDWTGPARADQPPPRLRRSAEALRAKVEALALRTSAGEPPSEAEARAQADAIAAAAEQQAISDAAVDESTILPTMPVAFVANGENITYLEPNFVPYKMRPEVRALRMAIDVAKIP